MKRIPFNCSRRASNIDDHMVLYTSHEATGSACKNTTPLPHITRLIWMIVLARVGGGQNP